MSPVVLGLITLGVGLLLGFVLGVIATAWGGLILFESSALRKKKHSSADDGIKARG